MGVHLLDGMEEEVKRFILTLIASSLILATCATAGANGLAYVLGARQETEE
jgi:hypothetical protein